MTNEEHEKIVEKLEKKYKGRKFIYEDQEEEILAVYVDYRKDKQDMNRVLTTAGMYFLDEIDEMLEEDDK